MFEQAPMKDRWVAAGFQALYAAVLIVVCLGAIRLVLMLLGRTPNPIQPWFITFAFGLIVIGGFLRPSSSLRSQAFFARLRSIGSKS